MNLFLGESQFIKRCLDLCVLHQLNEFDRATLLSLEPLEVGLELLDAGFKELKLRGALHIVEVVSVESSINHLRLIDSLGKSRPHDLLHLFELVTTTIAQHFKVLLLVEISTR